MEREATDPVLAGEGAEEGLAPVQHPASAPAQWREHEATEAP